MREIKFRAWNKFAKKMIYFNNPHFNVEYRLFCFDSTDRDEVGYQNDLPGSYGMVKDDSSMTSYPTDTEKLIDWEVMQYTGLKDKNGKEIYEGDIIRDFEFSTKDNHGNWIRPPFVGFLKFKENFAEYFLEGINVRTESYNCVLSRKYWEIIGNIYENPELNKELLK